MDLESIPGGVDAVVIDGGCPLMFEPCDDGVHRVMRRLFTWTGKVPRLV